MSTGPPVDLGPGSQGRHGRVCAAGGRAAAEVPSPARPRKPSGRSPESPRVPVWLLLSALYFFAEF
jgi:hypothetical protein